MNMLFVSKIDDSDWNSSDICGPIERFLRMNLSLSDSEAILYHQVNHGSVSGNAISSMNHLRTYFSVLQN